MISRENPFFPEASALETFAHALDPYSIPLAVKGRDDEHQSYKGEDSYVRRILPGLGERMRAEDLLDNQEAIKLVRTGFPALRRGWVSKLAADFKQAVKDWNPDNNLTKLRRLDLSARLYRFFDRLEEATPALTADGQANTLALPKW